MAIQIPGYRVIRKIDQGGMSSVYLAIQISVGRVVALKVMNPQLGADPAFNERFHREATIVGQLSHPNIVPIYDISAHEELNYIAMEYLPNGSVHGKMTEGLKGADVLRITREVANALDHAHEKGYVHRDIKPENILFRSDDSSVLSDFGVARGYVANSRMTQVGIVVGTPHYMSPEQTKGDMVDGRSDLYSLGVVFYEMLTGTLPYKGEETVTIALKHMSAPIPKLPLQYSAYQKLLEKMLAKDPDKRFQRGRDLAAAIEELEKYQKNAQPQTKETTDFTVLSLATALVSATYNALRWRWIKMLSLRWNQSSGFYLSHQGRAEDLFSQNEYHAAQATRMEIDTIKTEAVKPQKKWVTGLFFLIFFALTGYLINHLFIKNRLKPDTDSLAIINSNSPTHISITTSSAVSISISASSTASSVDNSLTNPANNSLDKPEVKIASETKKIIVKEKIKKEKTVSSKKIASIQEKMSEEETEKVTEKTEEKQLHFEAEHLPEMINIPTGSFLMGNKDDSTTMPVHKVNIAHAFAISNYEITFDNYDSFARATQRKLPDDNRLGRGNRPVINVSYNDAQAYTEWLTRMTGQQYRLPTESEWEYAARADSISLFWWGNDIKDSVGRANCRRGCNSKFSGLLGNNTAPVGSYPANGFGIYDTAGNVAEWVKDCYVDNYTLHPRNGQTMTVKNCETRVVRGGSAKDSIEKLASHVRESHRPEHTDPLIGFRVAMDLQR